MPRTTPRRRAALGLLGGAVALAGGALAATAAPASAARGHDQAAGPTTVSAAQVATGAQVTVSRTTGLVNQSVHVTWSGFPVSSATVLSNASSYDTTTTDPVRVYECRGADPTSSSDCYGSPGFAGLTASGNQPAVPPVAGYTFAGQTAASDIQPDGPANFEDTVTQPDGTGELTIQIFTRTESPSLGCDATDPCSVVVVPNLGEQLDDGPHHATEDYLDAPWAWSLRTVVPLSFAATASACPFGDPDVSVEGSPVDARLLASWRPGACVQSSPLHVDYTDLGEVQTRDDVASGAAQVGLTTRPIDPSTTLAHPLVYAPLAVTGIVAAFQIDDANGKQVHTLHLDARLVAKLLTASYRVADDPGVSGNPKNLFADKEFRALNPGVDWPSGSPGNHPLFLADLSDLTYTLTRWIDHDPDARAFLDGTPDPYGMHVNTAYQGLALPVDAIPLLDQHQSSFFQPVQGLDAVANLLSLAQPPGAVVTQENGVNVTTKPPRQTPGDREVIGFIDAADAAAFRLDTAALLNTGGAYVAPDASGYAAALAHMTADANGVTRALDLTSTDPAIYPLTMVTSAVLPTDSAPADAAKIAALLDYAAGPGQTTGDALGDLPEGYLPLPAALIAQLQVARAAVVAGAPASPSPSAAATYRSSPARTPVP
ncbi:MAG TPA: hypothetical protein VHE83_17120, partial [Mycobacteriales bacterium]|nr:hypothetical protein [Mycobacteriales bacterium]